MSENMAVWYLLSFAPQLKFLQFTVLLEQEESTHHLSISNCAVWSELLRFLSLTAKEDSFISHFSYEYDWVPSCIC